MFPCCSYNDEIGGTLNFPVSSESISAQSPSTTLQHNLGGAQLSMADIVKMGMQRRPSSSPTMATEVCNSSSQRVVPKSSQDCARSISVGDIPFGASQQTDSPPHNVTEIGYEPRITVSQHEPLEEWTLVDQSTEEPVIVDLSGSSSSYQDLSVSSSLYIDEVNSHLSHDSQKLGNFSGENFPTGFTIPGDQLRADSSGTCLDDGSFRKSSCYQQNEGIYIFLHIMLFL